MKLTTDALWFLCLFAFAAVCAPAQVRDRRVNTPPAPPTSDGRPAAQPETTEEIDENGIVRVDTVLVTVSVSVTDRDGRYVSDLRKEDFSLYEEGVEQNIAHFATVEKPFTVVLVLDTSASTWSKLGQIRDAALAFVEQLRPGDQVMVASFARGLTIKCEATSDRETIREAIRDTGKGLSTHLYDAIAKLMEKHLNEIQGRKAVVLFTDGVDATSDHATYESTVHVAEELDALIYPIYYDTYDPASDTGNAPSPPSSSRLPSILRKMPLPLPVPVSGGTGGGSAGSSRADYDRGKRYLRDLARLTGGRVYEASKDLRYLQACFSQIAEELRHQYSLGYYPNRQAKAGERRRIKVSVERPGLAVRNRDSYIYKPMTGVNTGGGRDQPQTPDGAPVLRPKQLTKTGER